MLATRSLTSPFLFGVVRPRIVLSETLVEQLDPAELRGVLTHELVHWQRHDTWVGWLQVVAQSGFWFHPFVWWANRQIRHERECVCDELVLRPGRISPDLLRAIDLERIDAFSAPGRWRPGAWWEFSNRGQNCKTDWRRS